HVAAHVPNLAAVREHMGTALEKVLAALRGAAVGLALIARIARSGDRERAAGRGVHVTSHEHAFAYGAAAPVGRYVLDVARQGLPLGVRGQTEIIAEIAASCDG